MFIVSASNPSASNPFEEMLAPVVNLLNMAINPILTLVGALGAIYCIFLGIKLAKAEEPQDREKAKGALKNAIIGFILIFVLMLALKLGLPAMQAWMAAGGSTAK